MRVVATVVYLLTHSQSLSRENCREVSWESGDIVKEHTMGTSCCKLLGKSEVPTSALIRSLAAVVYAYPDPSWLTNWGHWRALGRVLEVGPVILNLVSWTLPRKANPAYPCSHLEDTERQLSPHTEVYDMPAYHPKPNEVDDIECTITAVSPLHAEHQRASNVPNVVRFSPKEVLPISCLPESESFHRLVIVAHRSIAVWSTLEIQINKLLQVGTNDLVSVDEDDLLEVHGEKDIQEENLVAPNDPLLLALRPKPGWPLVRDEFILEAILLRKVRDEFLE